MSDNNSKIYGSHRLSNSESEWISKMGMFFPGERAVFRGRDVFGEFKNWGWMKLLYFCVTGKEPTTGAEIFLNGLYSMCFNYADPRIWNNRIAALAGTVSSTAHLGVNSASAVSEAYFYGGPAALRSLSFLYETQRRLDNGEGLEEIVDYNLKKHKVIFGFGRPVNINDERVQPSLSLLKEANLYDRAYVKLLLEIDKILENKRIRMKLNVGGVIAAFCADEGFTPTQINYILVSCFNIGSLACFIDSLEKPEGTLFPLRCERISYEGAPIRTW